MPTPTPHRLHTVVAALDFSPSAEAALVRAADLAERAGAALHLLYADVLFRSSGDGADAATPLDALRDRIGRFAVGALRLDSPAELDVLGPTVAVVRDVTAPAGLLRYAADVDAGLLVLGTHGRRGVGRLILGSVAEAVVAAAPCPVLTVPSGADAAPSPEAPVLVAVDFSERSRAALAAGRALAALYGAPVEAVHVVRDAAPYPGFASETDAVPDVEPGERAAVRERFERFVEPGPAVAQVHAAYGLPSRVVPALAAERRAGALVMGTHGRTGLARVLGSVTEATLRRAPCPVLTLKQAERFGGEARPARSAAAP